MPRRPILKVLPKLSVISFNSGVATKLDSLPLTFDAKMKPLIRAHADDTLHLTEAFDRLTVNAHDAVARQEPSPFGNAPRIDDVDLGRGRPFTKK